MQINIPLIISDTEKSIEIKSAPILLSKLPNKKAGTKKADKIEINLIMTIFVNKHHGISLYMTISIVFSNTQPRRAKSGIKKSGQNSNQLKSRQNLSEFDG